jgi:hypothetical protein
MGSVAGATGIVGFKKIARFGNTDNPCNASAKKVFG